MSLATFFDSLDHLYADWRDESFDRRRAVHNRMAVQNQDSTNDADHRQRDSRNRSNQQSRQYRRDDDLAQEASGTTKRHRNITKSS